jgi:hypothetical protein
MKIFCVGDIMLGRNVEKRIAHSSININTLFKGSDFVIGNCESPISDIGPKKNSLFKASTKTLNLISGFNILNLANNHIFDYGINIALDTKKNIEKIGIKNTGIGLTKEEALSPVLLEKDNKRIAFIGLTSHKQLSKDAKKFINNIALLEDSHLYLPIIRSLKRSKTLIVVMTHIGQEYVRIPDNNTIKKMRELIDMGADIIIGTHPHTIQGFEYYNNGLILYSLGDFIFDSLSYIRRNSLIAQIDIRNGSKYGLNLIFCTKNINFEPIILSEKDQRINRIRINKLSEYINTKKHIFYMYFFIIDKVGNQFSLLKQQFISNGLKGVLKLIKSKIVLIARKLIK